MIKTFQSDSGWGYTLMMGKKPIIKQPYIPAIQGQTPFKTRKQAFKTASLVRSKMSSGEIPLVTVEELDSLRINAK